MDAGLAEHAVVLELRLAERRRVAGDDNKLGLAGSEGLEGALVAESDLAGLHGQRQLGVDTILSLLLLRCHR